MCTTQPLFENDHDRHPAAAAASPPAAAAAITTTTPTTTAWMAHLRSGPEPQSQEATFGGHADAAQAAAAASSWSERCLCVCVCVCACLRWVTKSDMQRSLKVHGLGLGGLRLAIPWCSRNFPKILYVLADLLFQQNPARQLQSSCPTPLVGLGFRA